MSIDAIRSELSGFILDVSPWLIGCERSDLQRELARKGAGGGAEVLRKFIVEPHLKTLVLGHEEKPPDDDDLGGLFVTTEITPRLATSTAVAFVKRNYVESLLSPEGETKSLSSKLQIVSMSYADDEGDSTLEVFQNLLQNSFEPMISRLHSQGDEENHLRKRMAELVVSVQQAQQEVEVPLVTLQFDPFIVDVVAKVEGRAVTIEDFEGKDQNSNYLNTLQNCLVRWRKDASKVIRSEKELDGKQSAIVEVQYWTGLERALLHLDAQLQCPEVAATLLPLKIAKRFVPMSSVQADLGLPARLEAVQAVANFLRDVPLADLLSASSMNQITSAVKATFNQLKRLKLVQQYDISRAYLFVESISADLAERAMKILRTQNIMAIAHEEFEIIAFE